VLFCLIYKKKRRREEEKRRGEEKRGGEEEMRIREEEKRGEERVYFYDLSHSRKIDYFTLEEGIFSPFLQTPLVSFL
jgi:hypothetical protein